MVSGDFFWFLPCFGYTKAITGSVQLRYSFGTDSFIQGDGIVFYRSWFPNEDAHQNAYESYGACTPEIDFPGTVADDIGFLISKYLKVTESPALWTTRLLFADTSS
jgi:hypothetical protein